MASCRANGDGLAAPRASSHRAARECMKAARCRASDSARVSSRETGNLSPEHRQDLAFEPWIALEPARISPARMGERQHAGFMRLIGGAPATHGLGECRVAVWLHVPGLRMTTEAEDGLDFRQFGHDAAAPVAGAFDTGRKVGAGAVKARKAETHGQEREASGIIEFLAPYSQPGSEPVARGIVKRQA